MADVQTSRMTVDQSKGLLQNVLGDVKLAEAIHRAKLLLVGCGGIGCEVIKNLMLMGFHDVTMIDLDTIDVSNLNRQFLFNKTHINQSKSMVSANVAKSLFAHTDSVQLHPIHGSIQSADYNVDFFRQFTIVVNALDNRQARTHVNRMCLAADVPLIESGSEGYFGQTFVIKKNVSMCYECDGPKQDGRTFASCTIRNTPSLPIHCIVWAKHLFAQLFGEEDADNDVSPDMNDPELSEHANNKENEKEGGDKLQEKVPSTRKWAQNNDYDPELLFDKLFRADIEYLHTMDKLWKNRTKPRVLKIAELDDCDASTSRGNGIDQSLKDQRMWSMAECFEIFSQSVRDLKDRLKTETFLVWDKDDETALNFVTSVSNLRSHCFHIDRKSKFDVKSMAGNIIPAISSTNSIVGGLMVLQIVNLLRKLENLSEEKKADQAAVKEAYRDVCKHVYLRQISTVFGNLIAPYQIFEPNESCFVCNTKHIPEIEVAFNFATTTMCEFVEQLLMKRLNFVCPDIQLDGQPIIIWSKDDADEYTDEEAEQYRTEPIKSNSSIQNRTRLRVYDLIQNLTMIITLANEEVNAHENNELFYKLKIIREADSEEEKKEEINGKSNHDDVKKANDDEPIEIISDSDAVDTQPQTVDTQLQAVEPSSEKVNGVNHDNDEVVELSGDDSDNNESSVHGHCNINSPIYLDDQSSSSTKTSTQNKTNGENEEVDDDDDDDDCEIIEETDHLSTTKENNQQEMDHDDDVEYIDREEKRKAESTPEDPQTVKKLRIN